MVTESIPAEEKREALGRVLASRTFSRSEQLRAFLRYICEAEFEGRAQHLNEYALGVSVLGRPATYSPAEDSCVRTRAYELRNKLRSYYGSEASNEPILIEIEKGAYVPRFVRKDKSASEAAPAAAAPATTAPAAVEVPAAAVPLPAIAAPPPAQRRPSALVLGLAGAFFVATAALLLVGRGRPTSATPGLDSTHATPEMQALWKPFLDPGAPLLLSFDTRLFFYAPGTGLVVRDYMTNQAAEVAASRPLQAFQQRMNSPELQERLDYADFGAVHASFLLGRLLGRDVGLKHSHALDWSDIWNSNIIFIGKPRLNPTIRHSLEGKDFADTEHGNAIRNLHPLPGEPAEYGLAATHGAGLKYALITVAPGPRPGRTMMILSGSGAELIWALAEAVTDPARVHELMSHVLLPSGEAPPAFQIVISATFASNVPIKIGYVTHRVSKTP